MANVTDSLSLRGWLKDQPIEVIRVLVVRAALRVWPLTVTPENSSRNPGLALSSARALLISGVGSVSTTLEITRAARASANAAHAVSVAGPAPAAAAFAASATFANAASAVSSAASTALANAALAVSSAAVWGNLNLDATNFEKGTSAKEILESKLWSGDNPLATQWPISRASLEESSNDFSFWIDWYESILDGRSQNCEMLEEIALIDPEDWDQGVDHVAEIIAGIQAKYEVQAKARDALRILENPPVADAKIGHNNPPEDIEENPFSQEDQELVARVLETLTDETVKAEPNATKISQINTMLREIVAKLRDWGEARAKEMQSGFFGALGGWIFVNLEQLQLVIDALAKWIKYLP